MNSTLVGVFAGLGAGLLWGIIFVLPSLLPSYHSLDLTMGRYAAFGLVTLPLVWWLRHELKALSRSDWSVALRLTLVGNFFYYLSLASAIQLASSPLPVLIIGTLPIVIPICANWKIKLIRWRLLALPLIIIFIGLALVHAAAIRQIYIQGFSASFERELLSLLFSCLALAAWTWYPLKNSAWIAAHPKVSQLVWTSAQGLVSLPIALLGFLAIFIWRIATESASPNPLLGAMPERYLALMLLTGLGASWIGTYLWGIACERTPPVLTGQLIIFETLAGLGFTYTLYARWPTALETAGIAGLIAGVMIGIHRLSRPTNSVKISQER